VLWTIPQKNIKCGCVMMSLPQGHCHLFPSVAWYGHPLVVLRYKISLKPVRERPFRCLYLFLGLPLYQMSSWSIRSFDCCLVWALILSIPCELAIIVGRFDVSSQVLDILVCLFRICALRVTG